MKILPISFALLGLILPVAGQDKANLDTSISSLPETGKARVFGKIPDGSPPPPAEPEKRIKFTPRDILASRQVIVDDRRIIFEKVAPIELPSPPAPALLPDPADPLIAKQLETLKDEMKETKLVFVGASVFRAKDSPGQARTFVRFWPQPGSESVDLWSTADWEYLTGFASYQGADGQQYGLIMATSTTEVESFDEIHSKIGAEYGAPKIPRFRNADTATFGVFSKKTNNESLSAIQAIHERYNNDLPILKNAWAGRKRAAEERAVFLKANPPVKKDISIRYWRMDPAGRKGVTPKPAVIR